jgi:hypothetical protein
VTVATGDSSRCTHHTAAAATTTTAALVSACIAQLLLLPLLVRCCCIVPVSTCTAVQLLLLLLLLLLSTAASPSPAVSKRPSLTENANHPTALTCYCYRATLAARCLGATVPAAAYVHWYQNLALEVLLAVAV